VSAHRISRRAEILIVSVLVSMGVLSLYGSTANSAHVATGLAQDARAESTALYCTGFGGSATAQAASVRFFNTTAQSRHVDVTSATGHGDTLVSSFDIGAYRHYDLQQSAFPGHSYYGLMAIVSGAGVSAAVHPSATPSLLVPCVSRGSTEWSFSGLSTRVGATAELTMLNPSATPAVINLAGLTTSGYVAPQNFQGMVVKAHGLIAVNLGSEFVNSSSLYVDVHAVRGSVVPAVSESWNLSAPGVSLLAGSASKASTWFFADVPTSAPVTSTFAFANATNVLAHVTVRVHLNGYSISPFTVDVGPRSIRSLTVSPSSRVPVAEPAQVSVISSEPIAATLLTSLTGSKIAWMTTAGVAGTVQLVDTANAQPLSNLSIWNPGDASTSVTVVVLGSHASLKSFDLPAHASVSLSRRLRLADYSDATIEVMSTRPVLVAANANQVSSAVALVQNASGTR
jgi:hypothetical protein